MKRVDIDVMKVAALILQALPKGILLSTAWNGEMDTMTIGWGLLGYDWSMPVFTALVRDSRHTKTLLDASGEFSLNIPMPGMDVKQILAYCGTRSGRDTDKFADLGLTTNPGATVGAPAIAELPLTIECKVIYVQKQDENAIDPDILSRHYPQPDYHTAYTAKITAAYLLEEE